MTNRFSFACLAAAVVFSVAAGNSLAQSTGQPVAPGGNRNQARLFLKYAGDPKMRLFGIAIASRMYAVGGDVAAVGTDGYVSKVDAAGTEERWVAFKSKFVGPGADLDATGRLYLAAGDRILKITPAGKIDVLADGFAGAFDVKLDSRGNAYVADHREGRIYRLTPSLERTVFVDYHIGPGDFLLGGLAFDRDCSHLYSYEAAKGTLWRIRIAADGTAAPPEVVTASAPPIFSFAIDRNGNIFGADYDRGEVVRIDPAGNITYVTRNSGLKHPIGFRLGTENFHPGSAFVADDEGIKEVELQDP